MSRWHGALEVILVLTVGSLGERVDAQVLIPGSVELALAGEGCPTTLSAHWASLEATLCGSSAGRGGGAEDCRLTAGDQLPLEPHELILRYFPGGRQLEVTAAQILVVEPQALWLRGRQLRTTCGTWSWTLELAKDVQPVSKVHLLPQSAQASSGITSGQLEIAALLSFRNELSGKEVQLPWPITLDFVARWRVPSSAHGEPTLQLFVDPEGEPAPQCLTELKKCGRWELEPVER